MHLASKWDRLKRNVKMTVHRRIGGDQTGIQLGSFYDYDVGGRYTSECCALTVSRTVVRTDDTRCLKDCGQPIGQFEL